MKSDPQNPLCYSCEYRRGIPGDCHSACSHPVVPSALPLVVISALTGNKMPLDVAGIEVRGTLHGIKMGWFCWPFNFDPVWLEFCDGYKIKGGDQ